jgi:PhzF family phenazine biosynthesis protein
MIPNPMTKIYKVVDVFSAKPFLGNPVAVVLDARDLRADQMQAIARWTNLSETTFVLPPESENADYRLRIFTPDRELPFAGHPTLGSAHAIIESGLCNPLSGSIVQECAVGIVPIAIDNDRGERRLTLQMPVAKHRALSSEETGELTAVLDHPVLSNPAPELVDVGAVWMVAQMESVDALLAIRPDFGRLAALERRLGATGLSLYALNETGIETRSFAPSCGVDEDPVCGSGNGSIAGFRMRAGQIVPGEGYLARQGCMTGRDGLIVVRISTDGVVFVGGSCVTTVDGKLLI